MVQDTDELIVWSDGQRNKYDPGSVFYLKEKGFIIVIFFSAEGINKSYFPILVPAGVIGNILSFLVSN